MNLIYTIDVLRSGDNKKTTIYWCITIYLILHCEAIIHQYGFQWEKNIYKSSIMMKYNYY